MNLKYQNLDQSLKMRIFKSVGVEIFEDDIKYIKANQILYISPNGQDFDESNNFAVYKLGKLIGKGGFGQVYESKHRITHEKFAIKIINGSAFKVNKIAEMMFKEIGILKNLDHKNIVKVHNFFTLQPEMKVAIVLEYLEGGDLRQYIERQQSKYIEEQKARHLFLQIYSAMQYCHCEKIIHRDLKLENIMFTNKNHDIIKIVDFGISGNQNLINIDYTESGSVRYFAPEVITSKVPAHPSIDVWALGCILYWMLVGSSPFPQNSKQQVYESIIKGSYQFPKETKQRITKSAVNLIEKMLVVDISKRITMLEIGQHDWIQKNVNEIEYKQSNLYQRNA
ncbi:protein kinase domain protein [Ichthyophthirius multifiliis]|uniref:Protein kinase domain protein n=1 Tax=Ichthyophthirius multifiliis TaxID=5932 RepID=G0QLH9_ICHMU|nr:protein kinase domain protein [Ichthyophthirius multifiliis]EGR33927.1 protein kinase domain protein [Ichthyophthirius multifiliis]|eukprot:XP_004039231.1 protein kinase domain protein [Ichthyophthirius multifiliis]